MMNKKTIWFVIPTILLPYLSIFVLFTVFFCTRYFPFTFIMEDIFQGNIWSLLAVFSLYCLLSAVFSIVYFIRSIRQNGDPLLLAKQAMVIKLVQIPAFICIFILAVLLVVGIFTYVISFVLFLLGRKRKSGSGSGRVYG